MPSDLLDIRLQRSRIAPAILTGCLLAVTSACGDGRSLDPEAEAAFDEAMEARAAAAHEYAERVESELAERDPDAVAKRIEEEQEAHQAELEAAAAEREAEAAEEEDEAQ